MPLSAIAPRLLKVRQRRGGGYSSYFGGDATALESAVLDALAITGVTGRGGNMAALEVGLDLLTSSGSLANAGPFDFYISPTGNDSNPGTISQPWSITGLVNNRNAYSPGGVGKKVGLLDGTYNIASLMSLSRDIPALDIEGGSAGNPVIIQSVNPRKAIITAGGNTPYNVVNAMIGHTASRAHQGYLVIDGLYVTGGRTLMIEIGTYGSSNNLKGIVVRNCEITGNSDLNSNPGGGNTPGGGGGNASGITLNNCLNPETANNYIHDNEGHIAGSADHLSGIICWLTRGAWIHHNTIVKSGYAIYGKESVNQGTVAENNYFDISSQTSDQGQIYDFAGAPTAGLTDPSIFRNNVIVSYSGVNLRDNLDAGGWTTNCQFYNNTIIGPIVNCGLSCFGSPGVTRFLQVYNNIFAGSAGGYGNLCLSQSAPSLIDFNLYETQRWTTVPDGAVNTVSTNTYTSLAAFRAAMAGATGAEAHSAIGIPIFTNAGTFARRFTTTSGPAFQTGRVGGLITGAICNMGAIDPSIGCDFA